MKLLRAFLIVGSLAAVLLCSACSKEESDASSRKEGELYYEPLGSNVSTVVIEPNKTVGDESAGITVTVVVDHGGPTSECTLHTDEKKLGDALVKSGLATKEKRDGKWLLKAVDGDTADPDLDGTYWLLCDSERNPLRSDVFETPIRDGDTFLLVLTNQPVTWND